MNVVSAAASMPDSEVMAVSVATPEVFGALFDRYAGRVHRYLAASGDAAAAEALTTECFRVAFERRAAYVPQADSCLPWLLGIARNLARNDARGARRRDRVHAAASRPAMDDVRFSDVDSRLDDQSLRNLLRRTLENLPREQREVLVMFAVADMTYEEISHATAAPIGTVRSRLNRARSRVRAELEQQGVTLDEEQERSDG